MHRNAPWSCRRRWKCTTVLYSTVPSHDALHCPPSLAMLVSRLKCVSTTTTKSRVLVPFGDLLRGCACACTCACTCGCGCLLVWWWRSGYPGRTRRVQVDAPIFPFPLTVPILLGHLRSPHPSSPSIIIVLLLLLLSSSPASRALDLHCPSSPFSLPPSFSLHLPSSPPGQTQSTCGLLYYSALLLCYASSTAL